MNWNQNISAIVLLSDVQVGKHFYWEIQGITFHGQVFIVSWFVIALINFLITIQQM